MNPTEIAVFVDGPLDGREQAIPEAMNRLRLPTQTGIITYLNRTTADTYDGVALARAMVYELIRAFDMLPSRDDQGRLRYRYVTVEDL